jgi:hypothetical protein
MSLFCLRPPIPAPVALAVSKPCRIESTARGLAIARSYAIAGKESVRGSSSSPGGQHLANHCIVCKSVLFAARNQWKSRSQTHIRRARTEKRTPSSRRPSMPPVQFVAIQVTSMAGARNSNSHKYGSARHPTRPHRSRKSISVFGHNTSSQCQGLRVSILRCRLGTRGDYKPSRGKGRAKARYTPRAGAVRLTSGTSLSKTADLSGRPEADAFASRPGGGLAFPLAAARDLDLAAC